KRYILCLLMVGIYAMIFPLIGFAEEGKKEETNKNPFEVPNHVLDIAKENTYPNSTADQEVIEPSELAKELIEKSKMDIQNPDLIKMLNETSINPSPIGIGYRGMVYLGRWPLNYESLETSVNWEYQKINSNELNNLGGEVAQEMRYIQQE